MPPPELTDELLMAFADEVLDPETAAHIAAAAADDPAVAARVALFRRTGTVLRDAAAARPAGPVPPALEDRVRDALARARAEETARQDAVASVGPDDSVVIPFRKRRMVPFPAMAAAASIALAVGLGAGFLAGRAPATDPAASPGAFAALDTGLRAALDTLPAGDRRALDGGGEIAVIASFRAAGGHLCREVEIDRPGGDTLVSVACHDDEGWALRFAVAAPGQDDTGYAPASSLDALDAYLRATGAGAPLDPDAETEALNLLSRR